MGPQLNLPPNKYRREGETFNSKILTVDSDANVLHLLAVKLNKTGCDEVIIDVWLGEDS